MEFSMAMLVYWTVNLEEFSPNQKQNKNMEKSFQTLIEISLLLALFVSTASAVFSDQVAVLNETSCRLVPQRYDGPQVPRLSTFFGSVKVRISIV